MTTSAQIAVSQKHVPYLVCLCNTVPPQQPKFKVGDQVHIRRKIETFHCGYRTQSFEDFSTISHKPTEKPPTYVIKDMYDKIIQGKFNENELTKLVITISETAN